ncbi:MAG: MarR family transcriptional regulator [Roseovarius sp.]
MTDDNETPGGAEREPPLAFAFFNEVGILHQLGGAMLSQVLPGGVHPSHFAIVNHLTLRGDGKTPIEIARAMQVTKNTMTHSLKTLERHGFIAVSPNPKDARGKLVHLTAEGRAFRERAIARVLAAFGAVLGEAELARMARVIEDLRALRGHLDANRLPPRE